MNKLNNLLRRLINSSQWSIVINLGLCMMIGYSTVELLLISPTTSLVAQVPHNGFLSQFNQDPPVSKVILDISVVKQAYLFGKSPEIPTNLTTATQPSLQTHLDLKLHGIYYSSNHHTSLAMITDSLGKTNLYHTSEPLPSGAILHEIHEKHVILSSNGQIEILNLLDKPALTTKMDYAKDVQNYPNADELSPGRLLGHYQHQLQTDPHSLMKLIKITINGLTAIQQLANTEQINLEVLRNQQALSFTFNVEK